MGTWIERIFLCWLPWLLCMRRPTDDSEEAKVPVNVCQNGIGTKVIPAHHAHRVSKELGRVLSAAPTDPRLKSLYYDPQVVKAFDNICFIAELLKKKDRDDKVDQDWKYVAMVLDRLFLIIFAFVCFVGTAWILLQAPTFYDDRKPIDLQYRPADHEDFWNDTAV
ncbi:acetylcholine receptor alpha subunit precursor [Aphelenchoides avenae]|nr:acetylcholine receptor alpha subunit precursor [Aphelenchus avenae]